jgi:O-antigen ligase
MTDADYDKGRGDIMLRVLPKALIIGAVTANAVFLLSSSYTKALWVGVIALFMSFYRTWQRFLEPICVLMFVVIVVALCAEPTTLAKLQTMVLAATANHSP